MSKVKSDEIVIFENPQKGMAPHPLLGIGLLRNIDISTYPGVARLAKATSRVGSSVITDQIQWYTRQSTRNTIWALGNTGKVYRSTDGGNTWTFISGNSAGGTGQGMGIWKNYLIVMGDKKVDAYGPLVTLSDNTPGTTPSGTITSTGTAVVGSGTTFVGTISVGDTIVSGGQTTFVINVTDNTHLTVSPAFSPNVTGATFAFYHWTNDFLTATPLTSTIAGVDFHPCLTSLDDKFYIGDGKYVCSLSELTTFSPASPGTSFTPTAKAITLATGYEIKCITDLGTNLMLGTMFGTNHGLDNKVADIFPYSRSSLTLGLPIRVTENGVHAMITVSNRLYALCGNTGKMFVTDGSSASEILQIPNYAVNIQDTGIHFNIYPGAIIYQKGNILFGLGSDGIPTTGNLGVWGYDIATKKIQLKNTISTGSDGSVNELEITALLSIAPESYLIGWRDSGTYGVDLKSAGSFYQSYSGIIETQLAQIGESLANRTIQSLEFYLTKALTGGQGIKVKYRKDLSSSFTLLQTADYATFAGIQSINISAATISNAVFLQLRLEITSTGSDSPELVRVMLKPSSV